MRSIADRIAEAGNRPAGWDYLRLVLASSVIFSHAFYAESIQYIGVEWLYPWRGIVALILPCFFALSGFLVAGSLQRTSSLITFLGLRGIRLLPALIVETTLSALILGPIFTTVSLPAYFQAHDFFRYFGNILGIVHFTLPGVFKSNPSTAVNSQLWTLPLEMQCYAVLSLLAVFGIVTRRRALLSALILLQVFLIIHLLISGPSPGSVIPGRVLVGSFLAGSLIYAFRESIPHNATLFSLAVVLTIGLLSVKGGDEFLCFPAAYATAWLGVLNPPRHRLLLSGDYSYGLYLYGFPIQQAITALGVWAHHWWISVVVGYPAAFVFAVLSWWCIERPALGLKAVLVHCEKAALRFPPLRWHSDRIYSSRR